MKGENNQKPQLIIIVIIVQNSDPFTGSQGKEENMVSFCTPEFLLELSGREDIAPFIRTICFPSI